MPIVWEKVHVCGDCETWAESKTLNIMKIIFTYCQRRSQVWGFFMRCKRQSGSAKQGGRERISVMVIPPREGSSNKYEAPNERQNNELWSAIPRIEKKRFNEKNYPAVIWYPSLHMQLDQERKWSGENDLRRHGLFQVAIFIHQSQAGLFWELGHYLPRHSEGWWV